MISLPGHGFVLLPLSPLLLAFLDDTVDFTG